MADSRVGIGNTQKDPSTWKVCLVLLVKWIAIEGISTKSDLCLKKKNHSGYAIGNRLPIVKSRSKDTRQESHVLN